MDKDAQKRVTYAVRAARTAILEPGLSDIYLRRFHRAMDALMDAEEHRAVSEALHKEPWWDEAYALVQDPPYGGCEGSENDR